MVSSRGNLHPGPVSVRRKQTRSGIGVGAPARKGSPLLKVVDESTRSNGAGDKIGNVLAGLPNSEHTDPEAALAKIYDAEDRKFAEAAARAAA